MTEAVSQIISRIDGLSAPERAEVAYAYICSLEPDEEGVAEAWEAELSQRADEIQSGQVTGKPANQVFAELSDRRP